MGRSGSAGRALAVLAALLLLAGARAQRDCYGAMVEVAVVAAGSDASIEAFYGYPVPFGARLNDTPVAAPLAPAVPLDACADVAPPAVPFSAALVARGNCTFTEKARALQAAGYSAMLLYNNEPDCVFMAAPRNETRGLQLAVVSLTRQAGEALLAALAEHPGAGELRVQLRMPAEGPVDWSSLVLWVLATGTVAAGGLWAGYGHWAGLGRGGGEEGKKPGGGAGEVPTITIGPRAAVGFVVLASAMLLLLFFFLDKWLAAILVCLFGLGAWQATSMVLFSALQHHSTPQWRSTFVRLPLGLGLVPLNGLLAGAAGAMACGTWVAWHNSAWSWPLQDGMGVCFILVILKQFFLPNLKVASILLCLAFVYDVWWVFLQPLVTGGASVMIEVATGGASHEQLPMVLRVPHNALGTNPAFAILGLGDVVLPGLLAVFCRRFDLSQRLPPKQSYFLPCVVGYGGGMLATYAALWFSWFGDQGQPALLYLVPATLGTTTLLALWRGQWRAMWDNDFETGGRDTAAARAAEAMEAGAGGAGEPEPLLLPDGGYGRVSPSRERLLPPSPFDRSRSSSRESDLRQD